MRRGTSAHPLGCKSLLSIKPHPFASEECQALPLASRYGLLGPAPCGSGPAPPALPLLPELTNERQTPPLSTPNEWQVLFPVSPLGFKPVGPRQGVNLQCSEDFLRPTGPNSEPLKAHLPAS